MEHGQGLEEILRGVLKDTMSYSVIPDNTLSHISKHVATIISEWFCLCYELAET